jgi:hypothetical protein
VAAQRRLSSLLHTHLLRLHTSLQAACLMEVHLLLNELPLVVGSVCEMVFLFGSPKEGDRPCLKFRSND